tara:strand:+ start:300 stop:410 length:111 start_codon:yes stop_codon:yes gene_type:complete
MKLLLLKVALKIEKKLENTAFIPSIKKLTPKSDGII